MDERFCAPRRRDRERLADEQKRRPEESGPIAEPGAGEPRMEAVDRDARAGPATRELAREQDVAQFRARVSEQAAVEPGILEVVEVEPRAPVHARRRVDDA